MKAVMACAPLNSISQGSLIGLNGFLLLFYRYRRKIHLALNMLVDMCSQWSSFGFTSKGLIEVLFPEPAAALPHNCSASFRYMLCPSVGFVRISVSTFHLLHRSRKV